MSLTLNMAYYNNKVQKGLPEFTYTGTYETLDDGNDNWRIKFKTSGTFTITKLK